MPACLWSVFLFLCGRTVALSVCHCHGDLADDGLLSLQNTEEEANLPLPLDIQTLKSFHLQRVKPLDPVEGFFPNPRYRLVFAMSPHYPGVLKTNR